MRRREEGSAGRCDRAGERREVAARACSEAVEPSHKRALATKIDPGVCRLIEPKVLFDSVSVFESVWPVAYRLFCPSTATPYTKSGSAPPRRVAQRTVPEGDTWTGEMPTVGVGRRNSAGGEWGSAERLPRVAR